MRWQVREGGWWLKTQIYGGNFQTWIWWKHHVVSNNPIALVWVPTWFHVKSQLLLDRTHYHSPFFWLVESQCLRPVKASFLLPKSPLVFGWIIFLFGCFKYLFLKFHVCSKSHSCFLNPNGLMFCPTRTLNSNNKLSGRCAQKSQNKKRQITTVWWFNHHFFGWLPGDQDRLCVVFSNSTRSSGWFIRYPLAGYLRPICYHMQCI